MLINGNAGVEKITHQDIIDCPLFNVLILLKTNLSISKTKFYVWVFRADNVQTRREGNVLFVIP